MPEQLLANYHTHTARCHHATGTEEEYIQTALRCGYKVLGFSDHAPWRYADPDFVSRIRMLPDQLPEYVSTLQGLKEKYADRIRLHIGLEVEYFPAYVDALAEESEKLGIEYWVFGCHYDLFWQVAADYPVKGHRGLRRPRPRRTGSCSPATAETGIPAKPWHPGSGHSARPCVKRFQLCFAQNSAILKQDICIEELRENSGTLRPRSR